MRAAITAGLAALAVVLAPHAHAGDHAEADPIRQAAEQYGPGICTALHGEPVLTALTDAESKLTGAGFTDSEAGAVVADSVIMFCRDEIPAVQTAVRTN